MIYTVKEKYSIFPHHRSIGGNACQYATPMPETLQELKEHIGKSFRNALGTIDSRILQIVWNKFDYRFDVCFVIKGAYMNIRN